MNNEFLRQYKRISKNHGGDFDKMTEDLIEMLAKLLGSFPETMRDEIADYIIMDSANEEDLQRAADVVDFHNEELNIEESVLTDRDWNYIKEMINSFAAKLDMDWVTYAMQTFLDKGVI